MKPTPPNPAAPAPRPERADAPPLVVLTGNPNCGKTTVFNALTGLRAKVGNYAGVTVERKEGRLLHAPAGQPIRVLDLPGSYSLSPQSLDEQVARDVLLQRLPDVPAPTAVVVVADASNLQRHLYYTTQVIELGYPTIVALNMVDVAAANGHQIDTTALAAELGVPVVPMVASAGKGIVELRQEILLALQQEAVPVRKLFCQIPAAMRTEAARIAAFLGEQFHGQPARAAAEALLILSQEKALASSLHHYPESVNGAVAAARQRLEAAGIQWRTVAIEARYACADKIHRAAVTETLLEGEATSDRLDRVLTHKVWGTMIFFALMALMFQSIFTFARLPMELIQSGVDHLAHFVSSAMPPGDLNSLLSNGVVSGVGAVVVFLPQILLLFLFIGFLEDTGYMARAAFLMDRLMSKVGLHGKSFIPMLSSFACAIPGIMATRTIESPRDRLVTILVSPLMACSARLPVYTLLIAACIPDRKVLGVFKLAGLTMFGLYLLGIVVALAMAWVFKKTLLKGEPPLLIMELPPYKLPLVRTVARHVWDRAKIFLRQAGTVILGINILLWFLATYPKSAEREAQFVKERRTAAAQLMPAQFGGTAALADAEVLRQLNALQERFEAGETNAAPAALIARLNGIANDEAAAQVRHSFAGWMGRAIEPLIAPLGFDWKIGIAIVSSFAAREVFVSSLATIYGVGSYDRSESGMDSLAATLLAQERPDGTPMFTALTGLTLMVFYVFALQCVSTVAVVRRETNSWKWPLLQWLYMGVLAWGFAFATRHIGLWLGAG